MRRPGKVNWIELLPLVLAVCVGSALAHSGTSTMPFQVGALIDGAGAKPSQTGFFAFAEVAALAASMVLISPFTARVSPRSIALAGCVLAATGNAGIFLAGQFPLQLALAVVAGAGYGCIYASTIAAAAAAAEPDRLYAAGNAGALLILMGVMSSLPALGGHVGPLAVFAALAGLSAAGLPFFLAFRRGGKTEETRLSALRTKGAPGLLFAWAVFSAGVSGVYAFAERVGQHVHLPATEIAWVLSTGPFVGLLGAAAAGVFGRHLDRRLALVLGFCGNAAASLLLGFAIGLPMFAMGVFAYWVFTMFLYSYLLGTAALLDGTGGLGALGSGLERLGYGLGAALGGVVSERFGFSATGLVGFAGCMLALLGVPSVFRALHKTAPGVARAPGAARVFQIEPP